MPETSPLDLTVVVPTRDRAAMLGRCLDALLAAGLAAHEVLVVDSASASPEATEPAQARDVRVLRCERPGASRARNAGWREAGTSVVAFVDDDVSVGAGWPGSIVAPFREPGVVLVTGAVTATSGSGDRTVATTEDVPAGPFSTVLGNVGASANAAARRDALRAVGGFDEALGPGTRFRAAEDLDLFHRLLQIGHGWHASEAAAAHEQWRDRRALLHLETAYGIGFGAWCAKLARTDRAHARALVRYELPRLARDLATDLRSGYEFGVLSRFAWAVGCARGVAGAARVPVDAGRFRSPG